MRAFVRKGRALSWMMRRSAWAEAREAPFHTESCLSLPGSANLIRGC